MEYMTGMACHPENNTCGCLPWPGFDVTRQDSVGVCRGINYRTFTETCNFIIGECYPEEELTCDTRIGRCLCPDPKTDFFHTSPNDPDPSRAHAGRCVITIGYDGDCNPGKL